jgi:hypothetical protein
MIHDIETGYSAFAHNGKPAVVSGRKTPERSGWELLAWAILEQAVDDAAIFARWGLFDANGNCLPWPTTTKRRLKRTNQGWRVSHDRIPASIGGGRQPNEHRELKAWFLSAEAETFCDLIGCNLPPKEIFYTTLKNHGGRK